jgi:hypothetical protein
VLLLEPLDRAEVPVAGQIGVDERGDAAIAAAADVAVIGSEGHGPIVGRDDFTRRSRP